MLYKDYISYASGNVARKLFDILIAYKNKDTNSVSGIRSYLDVSPHARSIRQSKLAGKYLFMPHQGVYKILKYSEPLNRVYVRNALTGCRDDIRLSEDDMYLFSKHATAVECLNEYKKQVMLKVHERIQEMRVIENEFMTSRHSTKAARKVKGYNISLELAKVKNPDYDTDVDVIRDLINSVRNSEQHHELLDKFDAADSAVGEQLFVCTDCGDVEYRGNSGYTISDEDVCEHCLSNYYYSSYHSSYIHENDARPYYDSARAYHNEDADDWYSVNCEYDATYHDGAYFDTDTYYSLFEEDDDGEDDDGLNGYHGSYRNFVEQASDRRYVPLGVELEVYAEYRYDVVRSMRDDSAFSDTYLERDGSLSDSCGFEIITQPLGKTEWDTFAPKLLTHLLDRKVLGYNHPDSNSYGIHISINRGYLSPLQEARMSLFLTAEENIGFVKAIAQRNAIYGGSDTTQIGSLDVDHQQVRYIGGLRNDGSRKKKIYGMGKYSPLNLKPDVAECRIFQSTLHPQSFMKNLEFMWALVEWTNVKSATGSSWMHTDFVKWLAARPNADIDFGNLIAYLRRPKYIVKRGSGSISNTWLGLLPHITTKSQPVEDIEEEALAA